MDDFLLQLSEYPVARRVLKQLDIPVPFPLSRDHEGLRPLELDGRRIALHSSPESALLEPLVAAMVEAGAIVHVPKSVGGLEELQSVAESAPGEIAKLRAGGGSGEERFDCLVFDGTDTESATQLDRLYDFFHPRLRSMEKSGRALVVGRPPESGGSSEEVASLRGLEGFVRSLAKELGRYGSTANLLTVEEGAEERIAGAIRFFLSDRSVYVSGQPLAISEAAEHPNASRTRRVLKGATAFVTGAARGIGRSTARRLALEGATVLCVDLPGVEELGQVEEEFGGIPFPLDISSEDAPDAIADRADRHGGFDVVLHNAGITRDRSLANMSRDDWRQSLAVNFEAPIRITERLLEGDQINEWGRVLCMSSVAGIAGNLGQTNYATAKAGLIGFVRHLADELEDRHVTVNALAPGFIETRLTAEMPVVVREGARRLNNLSQGGLPSDVANAITFLASPRAQAVSGQVLRVCGGALVGA